MHVFCRSIRCKYYKYTDVLYISEKSENLKLFFNRTQTLTCRKKYRIDVIQRVIREFFLVVTMAFDNLQFIGLTSHSDDLNCWSGALSNPVLTTGCKTIFRVPIALPDHTLLSNATPQNYPHCQSSSNDFIPRWSIAAYLLTVAYRIEDFPRAMLYASVGHCEPYLSVIAETKPLTAESLKNLPFLANKNRGNRPVQFSGGLAWTMQVNSPKCCLGVWLGTTSYAIRKPAAANVTDILSELKEEFNAKFFESYSGSFIVFCCICEALV